MDYKKLIKLVWKGKFDFTRTFWIFYALISSILVIPIFLMEIYYESIGGVLASFSLIYILAFYVYIIFAIVGSWRASTKYILLKKKKNDSTFWGYAAKTYFVFAMINMLRTVITPKLFLLN